MVENKKDKFLDFEGVITEVAFSKKIIISVIVSLLIGFVCTLLPLDHFGNNTGIALGFFVASMLLLILQPWPLLVTSMLIPVVGMWLGFWDWPTFQSVSGSSMFLQFIAMIIVAAGAETTPIGRRIALLFLKVLGNKPIKLVIAVGLVTGLISAFVSNTATLIMMSGIANSILLTMNETPGKSKLGKAMMTVIPMASMVGGIALISSAPAGNAYGINLMETASNGLASISYAQWAIMGVPCFLVISVPMSLIYVWCIRLKNTSSETAPSKEYYDSLLAELGPMGGSEIRWLITVILMIVILIAGGNGTAIPLFFATITIMPVIGTVPVNKVFNHIPLAVVFATMFLSPIGLLFSNTGLGKMFVTLLSPILQNLSPYWFAVIGSLIMAVLCNLCVNGAMAIMALVIGVATPICISLGYNPTVVMFPIIVNGNFFFAIMLNSIMMINKGYGWWEEKDAVLPGFILVGVIALVFPLVVNLVAPLFGLSIYL